LRLNVKSRKRGIKASRAMLDAAMLNAGIKTQASLADKIADDENLDISPKDTVNRAFRQENVSPLTIARIAKVLGVEAYTLYLSKKEAELIDGNTRSNNLNQASSASDLTASVSSYRKMAFAGLLVIVGISLFWSLNRESSESSIAESDSQATDTTSILGQSSLVLYSYSQETDFLANRLNQELAKNYAVVSVNRALLPVNSMAIDIAGEYQADGVLTIREHRIGRFIGLQIYLYFNGIEELIWTDSYQKLEAVVRRNEIAAAIHSNVNRAFSSSSSEHDHRMMLNQLAAQKKYLQARKLLDDYQSELNLKKAQEYLHSAIQIYSNFAKGHAALCKSLIYESWRSDEKSYLEQAQEECNKATQISADELYVSATIAHLYRRSGRIEQSIELYNQLLKKWPNNTDLLAGISNAYGDVFGQQLPQFPNAVEAMISNIKKSIALEPDYWRHHSTFGLVSYLAGDMNGAAIGFGDAVELNPNELALINAGSINQCVGNLKKAKYFFNKARQIAPESYLGDDYLGSVYFYEREYQKAYQLKQKALNTFDDSETGGIHQMWGDLGDAYRLAGKTEQAVDAYLAAIKIVERDELRGNITVSDKVNRYFYQLILTKIAPQRFSIEAFNFDFNQLKVLAKKDLISSAQIKLAHSFYIYNELENAKSILDNVITKCPVYNENPDVEKILVAATK